MVREGDVVAVHFRAPAGESDLTIFAVLADNEGRNECEPVEVVKYRIKAMDNTGDAVPGPRVQDLFMPRICPPFFRHNLRFPNAEADGLPSSHVVIPKGSASAEILLGAPKDVEIQAWLQESETFEIPTSASQNLAFVQREVHPHGAGLVHVRVGRPGPKAEERWLHILCRRYGDAEFRRAVTLMVVVQNDYAMSTACVLPSMFGPFSRLGCFVHEPVLGRLQAGVEQKFRLSAPREILRTMVVFEGQLGGEEGFQGWAKDTKDTAFRQ